MKRFTITVEISTFAYDQADAEYIARTVRDHLDYGGQTTVKVASVKPEISHEQCETLGVCICGREV